MANGKLTAKQQAFIGAENLKKPQIADAIKAREAQRLAPTIATRQERQEFWTSVLRNEKEAMKDRLKAAELLGKSEGDFLERVEMDMTLSPAAILEKIRGRRE